MPYQFINRGRPPAAQVATFGLEWDGNDTGTNTSRRLLWTPVFDSYNATYMFKVFPKGPKTDATNPHYWTTFFWGYDSDFDSLKNYYGCHPFPFETPPTGNVGQDWEISVHANDYSPSDRDANFDTPSADGLNGTAHPVWNRWYQQMIRAFRVNATTTRLQFFFDLDLYVSSNGADGMMQHTMVDAAWGFNSNDKAGARAIVVGEGFKNNADTASWGGYLGREQFKGIIRDIHFYDALIGANTYVPTLADLADCFSELATPGSIRTPWYLKVNPKPTDVADDSGSGHNPSFPASLPSLWTGP